MVGYSRVTLTEIRELARNSRIDLYVAAQQSEYRRPMIYLHWSAGHYGQPFPDYHFNIDRDGQVYTNVSSLAQVLAHTWKRNTGAVAVSLLCCAGAVCGSNPQGPDDIYFGPEPPTAEHIETAAQVIAVLCQELGIPCTDKYCRTHAEQADYDGYGINSDDPQVRWDLLYLPGYSEPGGELLRGKANFYIEKGV